MKQDGGIVFIIKSSVRSYQISPIWTWPSLKQKESSLWHWLQISLRRVILSFIRRSSGCINVTFACLFCPKPTLHLDQGSLHTISTIPYNIYIILHYLQYSAISTISCAWINASFVICLQYPAKSTISRNIYNILRLDRCELHTISSNEFSPEQMHHEDFGTVLDLRNFLHDLYFFHFYTTTLNCLNIYL